MPTDTPILPAHTEDTVPAPCGGERHQPCAMADVFTPHSLMLPPVPLAAQCARFLPSRSTVPEWAARNAEFPEQPAREGNKFFIVMV